MGLRGVVLGVLLFFLWVHISYGISSAFPSPACLAFWSLKPSLFFWISQQLAGGRYAIDIMSHSATKEKAGMGQPYQPVLDFFPLRGFQKLSGTTDRQGHREAARKARLREEKMTARKHLQQSTTPSPRCVHFSWNSSIVVPVGEAAPRSPANAGPAAGIIP